MTPLGGAPDRGACPVGRWRQPAPARAQFESREGIALQNQILELRRQVQTVQDQRRGGQPDLSRPGRAPRRQAAGSDLVAQLLDPGGRAGGAGAPAARARSTRRTNQVQQQGAELGKRIDDLAFQMQGPQGEPTRACGAGSPGHRSSTLPLTPPPSSPRRPPLGPPSPLAARADAADAGVGDAGGQCRARPA